MTKRTTVLQLMLPYRDSGTPAYRWLYTALRAEILEGRLHPGARLPGTRDLANQYGLSPGTIVSAFEQLKSEGRKCAAVVAALGQAPRETPRSGPRVDRRLVRQ